MSSCQLGSSTGRVWDYGHYLVIDCKSSRGQRPTAGQVQNGATQQEWSRSDCQCHQIADNKWQAASGKAQKVVAIISSTLLRDCQSELAGKDVQPATCTVNAFILWPRSCPCCTPPQHVQQNVTEPMPQTQTQSLLQRQLFMKNES